MPDEYVRGEGRFPQSLQPNEQDAADTRAAYAAAVEAARPQGDAGGGDFSGAFTGQEGAGYDQENPPLPEYGPGYTDVQGPPPDFGAAGGGSFGPPQFSPAEQAQRDAFNQRFNATRAAVGTSGGPMQGVNPQAQLAQLNRMIQQTALSQPEEIRLARINQAVSQIQTDLDNGNISQDTARQLHGQVTHNAEQLWARQGSLPEMLARQQFLQAQHQAAQQATIQNMNAAQFTQHVRDHSAILPDGSVLYHNPVTGRELHIPMQRQQRPQATEEQQGRLNELLGTHALPANMRDQPIEVQTAYAEQQAQHRYDERYRTDLHAEEHRMREQLDRWRQGAHSNSQGAAPSWFRNRPTSVNTGAGSHAPTDDEIIRTEAVRRVMSEHDAAGVLGSRERPIGRGTGQGGGDRATNQNRLTEDNAPPRDAPAQVQQNHGEALGRQHVLENMTSIPLGQRQEAVRMNTAAARLYAQYGGRPQDMPAQVRQQYQQLIDGVRRIARPPTPATPQQQPGAGGQLFRGI